MNSLKSKFFEKAETLSQDIKSLLKEHGNDIIDQVTLSQAYGGMRGIKSMVWETSELDAVEGIRFRNYSIPELKNLLPKAPGGKEPLPEGLFYLMLIGEIPSKADVDAISKEWQNRSTVPEHVYHVIDAMPINTHPMIQFSTAILALGTESIFSARYEEGLSKADYWDATFEDVMNCLARLPHIAAYIYRRSFHKNQQIKPDSSLDWAGNFAHMLGVKHADFKSLMRLYLTIHADHEGGNASAHASHLAGSTLSDAYLSLSSAMNALAGPLHGLANQEVIKWIFEMLEEIGTQTPTKTQIADYVNKTLSEGKVVPGYGHAVLRKPDPRFMAQKAFAEDYIKGDPIVQVVWDVFEVVPPILEGLGKVKNPWPNVDAHSGALLVHYGFTEYNFYTVLFGVSRAMGVLAQLIWSRALGFPLERPKSITTQWVKDKFGKA